MAKIVFFSAPVYGHVNPTLKLVKDLVADGYEVIYYSIPIFKDMVEGVGATYVEYSMKFHIADSEDLASNFIYFYYFILKSTRIFLDDLIVDVSNIKPDLIIHDGICFWGRCVAESLKIKRITSIATGLFTMGDIGFYKLFKMIFSSLLVNIRNIFFIVGYMILFRFKYGIKIRSIISVFYNESDNNLLYTSKEFYGKNSRLNEHQYKFVGPSILENREIKDDLVLKNLKSPIVYISLGTILNNDICFYNNCIDALYDEVGTLIISVGDKININRFGKLPKNVIVKPHVDQPNLLKNVDLFITHGGMNSVQESLKEAVPMLIYPTQIEQEMIGKQVERLGCGILIANNNIGKINDLVTHILGNKSYYDNCLNIKKSFESIPTNFLVDVVNNYLEK